MHVGMWGVWWGLGVVLVGCRGNPWWGVGVVVDYRGRGGV